MTKLRGALAILCLALLFTACDEGDRAISGTITGIVSAEGSGLTGVTVGLSTGQTTTTDGAGGFSFQNLPSGNYVVEISGFDGAGAQFTSTTRTAVVNESGQTITVDFSGSFIRTSILTGTVTVSDVGALENVTATVSGIDSKSTTTDAEGRYTLGGLRTGTHTITISGFDANLYQFTPNPTQATVAVGATEVVSFAGTVIRSARVTGALFLDENAKNDAFDGREAENLLEVAGITLTLQGPGVEDNQSTTTDSTGSFEFDSLVAGSYVLAVDTSDADIPAYVRYGADTTGFAVHVDAGQDSATYFPFDIVLQTVEVDAYTGLDSISPGHEPVSGAAVVLYPTEQDATDGTNPLGNGVTDGDGRLAFTFPRADDAAPSSGTDNVVFAVRTADPPGFVPNGEDRIEIIYDPGTPFSLPPDTFDFQNTTFSACVLGRTVTAADTFSGGWVLDGFVNDTVNPVDSFTALTDVTGRATFTQASATAPLNLADTIYLRWRPNEINTVTPVNPGAPVPYTFRQFALPDNQVPGVTASGSYLRYVWNGFNATGGPGCIGIEEIQWEFADIVLQTHHEQDDSAGYSSGDDLVEATDVLFTIAFSSGDTLGSLAADVSGGALFPGLPTDSVMTAHADTLTGGARQLIHDPTMIVIDVDGSTHRVEICPLEGSNGCSTFAYGFIVSSVSGLGAAGIVPASIPLMRSGSPVPPRPVAAGESVGAGEARRSHAVPDRSGPG